MKNKEIEELNNNEEFIKILNNTQVNTCFEFNDKYYFVTGPRKKYTQHSECLAFTPEQCLLGKFKCNSYEREDKIGIMVKEIPKELYKDINKLNKAIDDYLGNEDWDISFTYQGMLGKNSFPIIKEQNIKICKILRENAIRIYSNYKEENHE